jgi:hypothetical protein
VSFDLTRLKRTDYVIAAGTSLFFILAFFPWFTFGDDFFGFSLSGFDSGTVTSAFVLFLLATAWAVLPAFVDLKLGFPHSWITVGLAALAWLLTLLAWIESFDGDFSVWALLGFLTATTIVVFAVLAVVRELRHRPVPSGGSADAAQGADQPATAFGQQQGAYGQGSYGQGSYGQGSYGQGSYGQGSYGPSGYGPGAYGQGGYGRPVPSYGQPAQPHSPPPPPPSAAPSPGGSTASGEGSSTPSSGERPTA